MRSLGIDNGLDGGLVLLDAGRICSRVIMPTVALGGGKRDYDVQALVKLIQDMRPDHVFVERAQSMPAQGVASTFSTGRGFGLVCGVLAALGIPHTIVGARTWQGTLLRDVNKNNTKAAAAIVCGRLWPGQDWRATDKCKKPHDGLTDAALIAEFGRRTLAGAGAATAPLALVSEVAAMSRTEHRADSL